MTEQRLIALEARVELIDRAFRVLLLNELRRLNRSRHQALVEHQTQVLPRIDAEIAVLAAIRADWDALHPEQSPPHRR